MNQLKALILIGGFGTRLRPLSCTRPKALFPILNKPLLQWTFERLSQNGIDQAILALNGLTAFHIKQHGIQKCGLSLKYSLDPPKMPLGTAGPIKKAEKILGHEEPFLTLNGDIFTDINFKEMIENHNENKSVATIALHEVEDPTRYGVAELAKDNRIKRFIEKPPKEAAPTNLINAGVYVLSPKIFEYIPSGRAVSMEREIFPKLAEKGVFYGHKVNGLWIDIGKPEEFLQTNKLLLDEISNKKLPKAEGFELKPPVAFDEGVTVGKNSVIGPYTVLGKNVTVGNNVQIRDSVVFSDAKIDDFAVVSGSLVGEDAQIGRHVKITEGCVICDQAKISEGMEITEKISVCPAKEVNQDTLTRKTRNIC